MCLSRELCSGNTSLHTIRVTGIFVMFQLTKEEALILFGAPAISALVVIILTSSVSAALLAVFISSIINYKLNEWTNYDT